MSAVWEKVVELIKQVSRHPATRRFVEEVKRSVIEHLIAWVEDVLKGQRQGELAAT